MPMKMDIGYWDRVAAQWADEIFNTLKQDRNRVILTELERAARGAITVADFGCGIGNYLPTLAGLFAEVHGFDHSEACVELARKRSRNSAGVKVHRSAIAPRSRHGYFDVVLCVNAAIAPERKAWRGVLQSACALLKPQGKLVLVVPSVESARLIAQAERSVQDVAEGAPASAPVANAKGIVAIEGVPTKHFTRAELGSELEDLGLRVGRIRRIQYSWRSQGVTPPPELRKASPWDWLAVARNCAASVRTKAA